MSDGNRTNRFSRAGVGLGVALAMTVLSWHAWAGGYELPGLGAEAMGRGGAFTAKADDGTALEYNIAGFARQRGTRLLLEGRLVLNSHTFQRAGTYPVENMPTSMTPQPWSGQPYPAVSNTNGISGAPLVAVSSDFGIFDRWTFALGLTTPSASESNRTFPTTVNGSWPAPQRYDVTNVNLLVVYPMLAAAVRVTKWFDVGLALQMVYGKFDLKAVAFGDVSPLLCPTPEYSSCDSNLNIRTNGFTATGALGLLFHPLESLHLGVHLRGPIYLNTDGNVTASSPAVLPVPLDPGTPENPAKATLAFRMPWILRLGLRYAFMKDQREIGDIEVNGTYETWHQAQGTGDKLSIPDLGGIYTDINATLVHHYKDTGSVRVGGAYNHWFKNDAVLTVRAGVFYDSAATSSAWTRLDFDTLDKIGAAIGLGFKIRGIIINAAYNFIASPDRVVTDGRQQVVNGTNGSNTTSGGNPTPVFNNGTYTARNQVVFLGLGVNFDEALRKKRVDNYDGLGTR